MFALKKSVLGRTFQSAETTGAYNSAATAGIATGLVSGTRIATNLGWRMVESIAPGDTALTFDGGMQVVRRISRNILWSSSKNCPEHLWPLVVPAGALGNKDEMMMLPEQVVMIEADAAEELFNDPFALVHAADLKGFNGIDRIKPQAEIVVYTLHFDEEQVVFACSGALFHCPANDQLCLLEINHSEAAYEALPASDAQLLVDFMAQALETPVNIEFSTAA